MDKQLMDVAKATVAALKEEGLVLTGDYTQRDLQRVLNIGRSQAAKCLTGRYTVGGAVRFRRDEIDYLRKIGGKIEVAK